MSQKPSFAFPAVSPDQVSVAQGQAMLQSFVQPTVTAIATSVTAVLLGVTQQATSTSQSVSSAILAVLIPLFPYLNAVVVFGNTFRPLQRRLMEAVGPVFAKMDDTQEAAEAVVDDLGTQVDRTVDRIQTEIHEVIQPYEPVLARATQAEAALQKVKPDLDIPDPSDIDRECDEMQGAVGKKLDEAKRHLDLKQTIPRPLQSERSFYWRIVVPVAVLALAVQLAVVALTTTTTTATTQPRMRQDCATAIFGNLSSSTITDASKSLHGHLKNATASGSLRGINITEYKLKNSTTDSMTMMSMMKGALLQNPTVDYQNQISNSAQDAQAAKDAALDSAKDTISDNVQDAQAAKDAALDKAKDTIGSGVQAKDAALANASSTVHALKDQGSHFAEEARANATNVVQNLRGRAEDFEQDLEQHTEEYKQEFDTVLKTTVLPMLKSVVLSYVIALLQLGLAYLLTSDRIKTWFINRALAAAKGKVDRTLREYGVTDEIDSVLGTRMERVRDKVLRILKTSKELEELLGSMGGAVAKIGGAAAKMGDAADKASAVADRFGFRFGKKK